jgi:hypothetical protein
MKVLDLRCAHAHRFEGWFASEEDFLGQRAGGLLLCPSCGDGSIERLPSAPRLNVSGARASAPALDQAQAAESSERGVVVRPEATSVSAPAVDAAAQLQRLWHQAVVQVMANTVDVGEQFAEEARRIHYGEADERAIRGRATRDEAEALREEGIEVMHLPLPESLKGPIH